MPVTIKTGKIRYNDNGEYVEIDAVGGSGTAVDPALSTLSENPVQNKAIAAAINALQSGKQDKLTFDSTPTAGSSNPVTSGGVAEELDDLKSSLTAALACFARVAWTTPDGEDYYNAFAAAINPPSELVSISATYTQTRPVYVTDSLEVLRQELLVTATYANTSTQTINGYALFGILEEGTSTITVSYGGKTTTFTVTVSDTALLYKLPQPTTFDGAASTVIDSGVALVPYDRDFTIVADFTSTNGSTRQHVFYAGDLASPYNSIVLECKRNTYVWGVSSYSASIDLANVTPDSPTRIVVRHESGSDKYNVICVANGSLVRGEATTTRLVSSRNIFIGGMRDTDTALGLIGTVREFKAFTRYYSDAEAMAYVSEEGV